MKILYTVHKGFWEEYSGTPLIAKQYIEIALLRGHDVALVIPEGGISFSIDEYDSFFSKLVLIPYKKKENWGLECWENDPTNYSRGGYIESFFKPDIIHIIDWVDLDSYLLVELRGLGAPILRHLWNFEDICMFNEPIRFNKNSQPCKFPIEASQCGACGADKINVTIANYSGAFENLRLSLGRLYEKNIVSITEKVKKKWSSFIVSMEIYDHLLFPSNSFMKYFLESMPIVASRNYSVINHGMPAVSQSFRLRQKKTGLNFVFLNGGNARKGWLLVQDVFGEILLKHNINLRIYGVDENLHKNIAISKFPNVQIFEKYKPSELGDILRWADIGLIPTSFETFCRVVREFISHGVIPIATNAFGIPEVVKNGVNGIILADLSPQSLRGAIEGLINDERYRDRLLRGVMETKLTSSIEEFDEIEALYKVMIENSELKEQVGRGSV